MLAATAWGCGDFGGGLLSRRSALLGVVLGSQLVGMVLAGGLAIMRGETSPPTEDVAWSVLAGLVGGIGMAMAAVILVSRVPSDRPGPSGLGLALIAGVSIGAFGVVIAQISEDHALGPLVIIRATEAVLIGAIIIAGRQPWRVERRLLPAVSGVGLLDMTGNAGFILAIQSGALAVAAVLSSLYPVVTVILAAVFLRERVTPTHAVGIVLAMVAIACIAVGSA